MKKPLLFLALSLSSPTASNGFAGIDSHHTFSRLTSSTSTSTRKDILGLGHQCQAQAPVPVIGTYVKSSSKLFSTDEDEAETSPETGTGTGAPNNKRYVHIHVNEETASILLDPDGDKKPKASGSVGPSSINPDGDLKPPKPSSSNVGKAPNDVADSDDTEQEGPSLIEEIKSFTQDPSTTSVHVHFHPTSSSSSIGNDGDRKKKRKGNVGPSSAPVEDSKENDKLTADNIDAMHASILETLGINDTSTGDAGNVHVHFDLASLQPGNKDKKDSRVASMNDITVPQDVETIEGEEEEECYERFDDLDKLPIDILMTGGKKLREQGLTGKGIKVGVIDTGIDRDHPGFNEKVLEQKETWFRHGTPLEGTSPPMPAVAASPMGAAQPMPADGVQYVLVPVSMAMHPQQSQDGMGMVVPYACLPQQAYMGMHAAQGVGTTPILPARAGEPFAPHNMGC